MKIKLTVEINKYLLTAQRRFLNLLITAVADGGTYPICKADLDDLIGIQGILEDVAKYANYKPCINKDAIADLASKTINMDVVENALIDFWSSPEGADDLAAYLV